MDYNLQASDLFEICILICIFGGLQLLGKASVSPTAAFLISCFWQVYSHLLASVFLSYAKCIIYFWQESS